MLRPLVLRGLRPLFPLVSSLSLSLSLSLARHLPRRYEEPPSPRGYARDGGPPGPPTRGRPGPGASSRSKVSRGDVKCAGLMRGPFSRRGRVCDVSC